MQLITSEGLARIETHQGFSGSDAFDVCVASGDVRNCFHRLKLPQGMHRLFALAPIPAKYINTSHPPDAVIYPCMATFPMGFSWSVWVAQSAGQ